MTVSPEEAALGPVRTQRLRPPGSYLSQRAASTWERGMLPKPRGDQSLKALVRRSPFYSGTLRPPRG